MDPGQQKAAVAAMFGRAAQTYDSVGLEYFSTFGRELVRRVGVTASDVVVDVGAGRGAATFPAAEAGARVVAGDLSESMVERLAADAAARGLDRVEVRVMDAEAPDLADASADVVLCAFVIFLLPDPEAALAAYRRLLRPGGRLGVTTFTGHDAAWNWIGEVLGPPPPVTPGQSGDGPVSSPERLADSMRAAGFDGVTAEVVEHDFAFASADQWWAWAWSHGMRGRLEPLPPDELERVRREAYARMAEFARPDGSLPLRQRVCYAVGRVT